MNFCREAKVLIHICRTILQNGNHIISRRIIQKLNLAEGFFDSSKITIDIAFLIIRTIIQCNRRCGRSCDNNPFTRFFCPLLLTTLVLCYKPGCRCIFGTQQLVICGLRIVDSLSINSNRTGEIIFALHGSILLITINLSGHIQHGNCVFSRIGNLIILSICGQVGYCDLTGCHLLVSGISDAHSL